jgi:hypothetical protein
MTSEKNSRKKGTMKIFRSFAVLSALLCVIALSGCTNGTDDSGSGDGGTDAGASNTGAGNRLADDSGGSGPGGGGAGHGMGGMGGGGRVGGTKPGGHGDLWASAASAAQTLQCPQVDVLQQAQTLTAFLPGRTDVAAQITTARITGIAGFCELKRKNKQRPTILVKFKAGFEAGNGPADNGATLALPWFVAITRGDRIISKSEYTAVLKFNGNMSTAEVISKPLKVELPYNRMVGEIQILVGFEMTPVQLAYAAAHPDAAP